MIREPVVSGQFYPSRVEELEKIIDGFTRKEPYRISAKAVILPHAGYVYSGKVAVSTVNKVIPKQRLIILGTNHSGYGDDFSLWPEGTWKIPYGGVEIDQDLAHLILNAGKYITPDYSAHTSEHSIEVELPILYHFFKDFKFVPIVCKETKIEVYREAALQICAAVNKTKEDIFFVASTDMTHYEPDSAVRKKDMSAIESIVNIDAEDLINKADRENISMCGIAPVAVLLFCMKSLGVRKAQVALYQTSADSNEDYSSVVGYAGIIIK